MSVASGIGREAMIPNPHLAALAPFVGEWTTVGEHAMIPGVTLHGRTGFAWHDGGAFLCVRTEIDEPKIPSSISFIGSDDERGALTMLYFDERAVTRRFDVTVAGGVLRWSRMAPGFSQRFTLTVLPGGDRLHGVSEMSKDGATWEKDLELRFTRGNSSK